MKTALIKLHISILLAGFTGVFGKLIRLGEIPLVWWRLVMVVAMMYPYLVLTGKNRRFGRRLTLAMMGIGCLQTLHWVLFYASIKLSTVSVALVCISLLGFFTAILSPLILKTPWSAREFVYSGITIAGIALIFHFDTRYRLGIAVGVVSSAVASLFVILNKLLNGGAREGSTREISKEQAAKFSPSPPGRGGGSGRGGDATTGTPFKQDTTAVPAPPLPGPLPLSGGEGENPGAATRIQEPSSPCLDPLPVFFREVVGGLAALTLFIPLYLRYVPLESALPGRSDLLHLFLLSFFCTVVLYVIQLQALGTVSAFTVNLSLNLEPVYAIILASIFLGEAEDFTASFYLGLGCILLSVALQTARVLKKRNS